MKEYLEDVPLCTIPINIGKHWVAVYIDRSRGAAERRDHPVHARRFHNSICRNTNHQV